MIRPGDWMESVWKDPNDVAFGSYGLDQCLDLVEKEYRRLLGALEIEGERTTLPEEPTSVQGLHDLLVR